MSQQQVRNMKPFISVLMIMGFLFGIAFLKMENRRMGYAFMKMARQEKQLRIQQREKVLELARVTGPDRVRLLATQELPMKKAGQGQIIQMGGNGVAIIQ